MNKKLNKYVIVLDLKDDHYLIYDTFHRNISKCNKSKFEANAVSRTIRLLDGVEYPKEFYTHGLIIDSDIDEYQLVAMLSNKHYNNIMTSNDPSILLYLTMQCNFACQYCFQNTETTGYSTHNITNNLMSNKIIDKSLNLAQRIMDKSESNVFTLALFGGEPLLSLEKAMTAINKYKDFVSSRGFQLSLRISTNGYNFNKQFIDYLNITNLHSVYILLSIDGMPEVHNKRRPLMNGEPTFDVLMRNIEYFLDNYNGDTNNLVISPVVDRTNIDSVMEFGEYLHNKGYLKKIKFSKQPRDLNIDIKKTMKSQCSPSCLFKNDEYEEVSKTFVKKMERLTNCVYGREIFSGNTPCQVSALKSFTIDPVGNVYRCIDDVPYSNRIVGHVNDERISFFNKTMLEYLTRRLWDYDNCRNCNILPLCISRRCIRLRMMETDCSNDKRGMEKSIRLDLFELALKNGYFSKDIAEGIQYSDDLFYNVV